MADTEYDPDPRDDPLRPDPDQRPVIDNTRWAVGGGIAVAGIALAIGLASGPDRRSSSGGWSGGSAGEAEARRQLQNSQAAEQQARAAAHRALAELIETTDAGTPDRLLSFAQDLMGNPLRDRSFEAGCGRLIRARIRARQGHTGDAVADYREAIRHLEQAGYGPGGEMTGRVLVRAATELAALVKDGGNAEDVRQALGRAVELTRAEAGRQPKSAAAQAVLARALDEAAAAAARARQPNEAEALLREAIAVNGRPSDPAAVARLARAHTNLGRVLQAAGRSADARAAFDAAERAAREPAASPRADPAIRAELARARAYRASLHLAEGRMEEARADAQAARNELAGIPAEPSADLAHVRLVLAEVLRAVRQFADALAEVEAALQPGVRARLSVTDQTAALTLAGELLHDLGRPEEAWRRLVEARTRPGPANDRDPRDRADRIGVTARVFAAQAAVLAERLDWSPARGAAESAIREFDEYLKLVPDDVGVRRERDRMRAVQAEAMALTRVTEGAGRVAQALMDEAKARHQARPDDPAERAAAVEALTTSALVLLADRHADPAGRVLREAEALAEGLPADDPAWAVPRARVAYARGLMFLVSKDPERARAAADEAHERLGPAARGPFDPAARRLTWDVAFLRADVWFAEGKEREGMAALKPLLDEPSTDRRTFRAVARLNEVLARVAKDPGRPADEKEQLARAAAAEAVAFLRLAVRRGARWADPEFPRMAPLRDRPEFRAAEPDLRVGRW